VLRIPPDGKLEASGSLWMSWAPLKRSMGRPSSSKVRKASCFSAVSPVCGWNQWQKWLAPLPRPHSLIACATSCAMAGSRWVPRRIVSWRDLNTGLGSFSFIAVMSKVLLPNTSTTLEPLDSSGSDRMLRDMTSPTAHSRPVTSDMTHLLLEFAGIIGT
jgi:hypothetical protein